MKSNRIIITIFLIGTVVFSIGFFAWRKEKQYKSRLIDKTEILNDSRHTVFSDTTQIKWIIKDFVTFWTPGSEDISIMDLILDKAINSEKKDYWRHLTPATYKNYYQQYIFYKDTAGDSIVCINAFCYLLEGPVDSAGKLVMKPIDWRNNLIIVKDGGDCFWTIKINLSKMTYFDFMINGMA
jgi:hypothetical protein